MRRGQSGSSSGQNCRHGSNEVEAGEYRGFTQCKSKGQADLEAWAFDQLMRDH